MLETLPAYRVRISPRGRNIRLRVTSERGLEVAIPRGYDPRKVPAVLRRKVAWIERALQRAERLRKESAALQGWQMPTEISLPAVGQLWTVSVRESDCAFVAINAVGSRHLVASGAVHDEAACRAALSRWLMRQTRENLVPRLGAVSRTTGLRYERVLIKRQRTRWASYSRLATVSLNAKLMFLPPELVEYVMTHELCHRIEMNHGKRFWQVLSRYSPEFRVHDTRMREMWKAIPPWAS